MKKGFYHELSVLCTYPHAVRSGNVKGTSQSGDAGEEGDGRDFKRKIHEGNGDAFPGFERTGTGGGKTLENRALPVLSVVDPELIVSVPPKFTAFQGFDALFHSTECYISKAHNPMGDMLALTAIENIGKYLVRAVKDGSDLEAREGVAFANNLSGQVMTVSCCTSEHSMEHAMSACHQELPHGAGLIMIAEAYYQHFVDCHACDERFIAMAKALGKADAACAQDFVDALVKLQKDCVAIFERAYR